MTRFSVAILPEAEAELRAAFLWYYERSPLAADAFRTEVLEAIESLGQRADMWAEDDNGVRRCVLRRFPYTIVYEVKGDVATVLAVAHQRRRPAYWRLR